MKFDSSFTVVLLWAVVFAATSPTAVADQDERELLSTIVVGNNGKAWRHGKPDPTRASPFPLGLCQGDCDSDRDCAGNLVCYQREADSGKNIPGCVATKQFVRSPADFCGLPPGGQMPKPQPPNPDSTGDVGNAGGGNGGGGQVLPKPTGGGGDQVPKPTGGGVGYPVNPVPRNPPRGYFNYDINSPYGPRKWYKVDTSQHWTKEFGRNGYGPWKGHITKYNPANNICRSRDKQSPLNLAGGNVACEATHEIRTECANHPLMDAGAFEKQILPHKLSIVVKRRPCLGVLENGFGVGRCKDGERPPMVDFPKYSSKVSDYSDMHHYDIKVPGEHVINGARYDAEVQMFYSHLGDPRFASIAVPVRASGNANNPDFQEILDEFQVVYNTHKAACSKKRRLRGHVDSPAHNSTEPLTNHLNATRVSRRLQARGFNPYSDRLMPGMFFYRYDGSITEPPCLAITWWVMDQPMVISTGQLVQLKRIMFTHVDPNCWKTSVHNKYQSVARDTQRIIAGKTKIQNCKAGSYRSDVQVGRPEAKQCRRIRWP